MEKKWRRKEEKRNDNYNTEYDQPITFMETQIKKETIGYYQKIGREEEEENKIKREKEKVEGKIEKFERKRKRYTIVNMLRKQGIIKIEEEEEENRKLEPPKKKKKRNEERRTTNNNKNNNNKRRRMIKMIDENDEEDEDMVTINNNKGKPTFNREWYKTVTQLSFIFSETEMERDEYIELLKKCTKLNTLNIPTTKFIKDLFHMGTTMESIKRSGPFSVTLKEINIIQWKPELDINTMIRTICAFPNLERIGIACCATKEQEENIQNLVNEAYYVVNEEEEDRMTDTTEEPIQVHIYNNTGIEGLKKSIQYKSQLYTKSSEYRSHINHKFKPLVRFLTRQYYRQQQQAKQNNYMEDDDEEEETYKMNDHWWHPYLHGDNSNIQTTETLTLEDHQLDMALAVFSETLNTQFNKTNTMEWSCSHWQQMANRFPDTGKEAINNYCDNMYHIPRKLYKYKPPSKEALEVYKQKVTNSMGFLMDGQGIHMIVGGKLPNFGRMRKERQHIDFVEEKFKRNKKKKIC